MHLQIRFKNFWAVLSPNSLFLGKQEKDEILVVHMLLGLGAFLHFLLPSLGK